MVEQHLNNHRHVHAARHPLTCSYTYACAIQLTRQVEQTLDQKAEAEIKQARREERMAEISVERERERRHRVERNSEVRVSAWCHVACQG